MLDDSTRKRRKLRKGTHSCWECKRRKARCVFPDQDEAVCVRCERRGIKCVSQSEGDDEPDTKEGATTRRLLRIETMLETLLERQTKADEASIETSHIGEPPMRRKRAISLSPEVEQSREVSPKQPSIPRWLGGPCSESLYRLLPSQEECRRICSSTKFLPCFFQQMLTRDWKTISASEELPILTSSHVARLPSAHVHPVLLAQKILMLACLAQFVWRDLSDDQWKRKAEQMASAAIEVLAKEESCHCAEGLECLMLEATYHANDGKMRKAFSAVRRAMTVAQLLGIHRPHPRSVQQLDSTAPAFDPAYMWYRIVSADRLFSLALGLPQGYSSTIHPHLVDLAGLDPEQQLERRHSEIASWISDRNERDPEDTVATATIDQALQDASSLLPSTWWLPPALSSVTSRRDMFLATTRLVTQILHFNLINQTHLPYLHLPGPLHAYSKSACATSSREILTRYLILQASGFVAHTSHIVSFFSLTAASTLTLAHLEHNWHSPTSPALSALPHTRASDRAMVLKLHDHMARLPGCKGAQILDALLQLEEEAFSSASVGSGVILKDFPDRRPFFELGIPYFGLLRLDSARICFRRRPEIEDVSVGVKTRRDLDGGVGVGVGFEYGEVDFEALFGGVGGGLEAQQFGV